METKIKWKEGEGHITATYKGSGSGPIVFTSDPNEGIDREQNIIIRILNGRATTSLKVKQIGLREIFTCVDGEFIVLGSNTFNVLKK